MTAFRGSLVGLEIEYFVVDAVTLEPRDVFAELSPVSWAAENLHREVGSTQIEIASPPFASVSQLATWLAGAHDELQTRLRELGVRLLPLALYDTAEHPPCDDDRTRTLLDIFGPALLRHAPLVAADQVNVGTDLDDAMPALEILRRHLPLLLTVAAASPLLEGRANDIACNRLDVIAATAAQHISVLGVPRRLHSLEEHAAEVAALPVINRPSGYYKWVRPMPERGVAAEVRCMDKQPTLSLTVAFAALCFGLARSADASLLVDEVDDEGLVAAFDRGHHTGLVDVEAALAMLATARRGLSDADRSLLAPLELAVATGTTPGSVLARSRREVGLHAAYRAVADAFDDDLAKFGARHG